MIRFYWDACVFISRFQRDPDRIVVLEHITDEAAAGKLEIVTSAFALAEVSYLNRKADEDQQRKDESLIQQFFDHDFIHVIQVDRQIATEAARIGRAHGLKPADAVHVATALSKDTQIIHTYDEKRLLKLHGKIGEPPLTIKEPSMEVQKELPFGDDEINE